MRYFTYPLTSGSITISSSDLVQFISIICGSSSSCSVSGDLPFQGLTPSAVTLTSGEGLNLSTILTSSPLEGIVITWISGTINIIVGK